jgi:hypothetical protein
MEIQVIDDNGPQYKDKLQSWQYHGSIYNVVPAKRGALKETGQWNSQEIYAKGSQIRITLNGTVIVDANLAEIQRMRKELEDWMAKNAGHENEFWEVDQAIRRLRGHPGLERRAGHIGFLGHGTRVEFRKMRIKEL